jgi:hypothetical protein
LIVILRKGKEMSTEGGWVSRVEESGSKFTGEMDVD